MPILIGTLSRYFGLRFLNSVLVVFAGIFALVTLIDYIEMMRRAGDIPNVSAVLVAKTSIYRVPQVVERILPFCVLIGAMSCYLNLSRRLELVIARSAGLSAWQFVTPALGVAFVLGIVATTIYNPVSAILQERSKRFESELFGQTANALRQSGGTFWVSQRTDDGQAIINAVSSRDQGINLSGVSIFAFDNDGRFKQRIEARAAVLEPGAWRLRSPPSASRAQSGCATLASMHWGCCRLSKRNTGSRPALHLSKYVRVLPLRKLCRSGSFPSISRSPSTPVWLPQAIDCSYRSFWRGHFCWLPWFSLLPP